MPSSDVHAARSRRTRTAVSPTPSTRAGRRRSELARGEDDLAGGEPAVRRHDRRDGDLLARVEAAGEPVDQPDLAPAGAEDEVVLADFGGSPCEHLHLAGWASRRAVVEYVHCLPPPCSLLRARSLGPARLLPRRPGPGRPRLSA